MITDRENKSKNKQMKQAVTYLQSQLDRMGNPVRFTLRVGDNVRWNTKNLHSYSIAPNATIPVVSILGKKVDLRGKKGTVVYNSEHESHIQARISAGHSWQNNDCMINQRLGSNGVIGIQLDNEIGQNDEEKEFYRHVEDYNHVIFFSSDLKITNYELLNPDLLCQENLFIDSSLEIPSKDQEIYKEIIEDTTAWSSEFPDNAFQYQGRESRLEECNLCEEEKHWDKFTLDGVSDELFCNDCFDSGKVIKFHEEGR